MLDSPTRRRKIIELLWDLAYRQVEGPDSGGEPLDPGEVWQKFNALLADLGLELTVTSRDGSEVIVPGDLADRLDVAR